MCKPFMLQFFGKRYDYVRRVIITCYTYMINGWGEQETLHGGAINLKL